MSYSGYKKYLCILLFSNKAFLDEVSHIIFILLNFSSRMIFNDDDENDIWTSLISTYVHKCYNKYNDVQILSRPLYEYVLTKLIYHFSCTSIKRVWYLLYLYYIYLLYLSKQKL